MHKRLSHGDVELKKVKLRQMLGAMHTYRWRLAFFKEALIRRKALGEESVVEIPDGICDGTQ